jgi:hypothetical protein
MKVITEPHQKLRDVKVITEYQDEAEFFAPFAEEFFRHYGPEYNVMLDKIIFTLEDDKVVALVNPRQREYPVGPYLCVKRLREVGFKLVYQVYRISDCRMYVILGTRAVLGRWGRCLSQA